MTVTELRTRWIEALRSDEYSQGRGNLKCAECGPDEAADFCCLGVLCDLVAPEKWTEKEDDYFLFEGKADYPPSDVLDLVGLTLTQAQELATFNDAENYTFNQIADFLEFGTRVVECQDCMDDVPENETCTECGREG